MWEENEFWIELSWRIDPDGALGIRHFVESSRAPGERLSVDEYYGWIFENSVPGLPETAAAEGLTPLAYMRRYGAFEVAKEVGRGLRGGGAAERARRPRRGPLRPRLHRGAAAPAQANLAPTGAPEADADGRRAGRRARSTARSGAASRRPSGTARVLLADARRLGLARRRRCRATSRSHVHPDKLAPDQMVLISTFRLPVQIHTRSANAKWLDEIAHTNPLWIHPRDAAPLGVDTGDLVRVETEIGHFVVKAWVTEGIRPGVVACSHHMGRWKLDEQDGQRQLMATVGARAATAVDWRMRRERASRPTSRADPDTRRDLVDATSACTRTSPSRCTPTRSRACTAGTRRCGCARPSRATRYGDIVVDTAKSHEVFRQWLARARSATRVLARRHPPARTG